MNVTSVTAFEAAQLLQKILHHVNIANLEVFEYRLLISLLFYEYKIISSLVVVLATTVSSLQNKEDEDER